jgi:hypothetical protein
MLYQKSSLIFELFITHPMTGIIAEEINVLLVFFFVCFNCKHKHLQEIYLEGALPAQSHLLVADSATEPEPTTGEDPAVVLSGKMTLSVISLESGKYRQN